MNVNGYREDDSCCYFHPEEVFVGVCPLCLNERLLVLAAKQGHRRLSSSATGLGRGSPSGKAQGFALRKPLLNLSKIFALGSLLNRLELSHSKSDHSADVPGVSTGQEDSFISIKFGDNGAASWERETISNVSLEHCGKQSWDNNSNKETKHPNKDTEEGSISVTEHAKPLALLLRWRKPIGHLFHSIRWKRSNKGNVEGVNVRESWQRPTPTKRRTNEYTYI